MKPGDQRLLHASNLVATVLATGLSAIVWGGETALQVGFGAAVATLSVAVIGIVVWLVTSPHGRGGVAALVVSLGILLQVFGAGALIWFTKPDPMPFGWGFATILGSVVLAALIDGVRVSRGEPEFEELSFPDGWPKDDVPADDAPATQTQTQTKQQTQTESKDDDHA